MLPALAVPAAIAIVVLVTYWPYLGDPFYSGGDTWAHVWTSRISTLSDLSRVLTRPLMTGSGFPDVVARFYRPVSSLSYALDYALFGLSGAGFRLTDLLIHLAATLTLFLVGVELGLRRWAAAVGTLTFALHPIMASLVPSAPRRHDSLATLGILACLLLAARWVRTPHRRWPTLALAAGMLAFAELSKEAGFIGPVLVVLGIVADMVAHRVPWKAARSRAAVACGLMVTVSVVLFAIRWQVLGGLGGYYGATSPLQGWEFTLRQFTASLFWPLHDVYPTGVSASQRLLAGAVVLTILAAVALERRERVPVVLGLLWIGACGAFQWATQSVTPYQTYTAAAGLCFVAGGLWQGLVPALGRLRTRPRTPAPWLLAPALLGLLFFQARLVRTSPLLTNYVEWHQVSDLSGQYLAAVRPCLEATPAGAPVVLDNYPDTVDHHTTESALVETNILSPNSLGPAVYLTMPALRGLTFIQAPTQHGAIIDAMPRSIAATCAMNGSAWWVEAHYSW